MRDVLRKVHDVWGVNHEMQKKTTPDNILRIFGLLLTDSDLKDYVPDLTGDTKGGDRPGIDASKGRVLACYQLLLNKFIDEEVVVTLPSEWTHPSTREKVDKRTKDGVFDKFGKFDPNNIKRMKLAWLPGDMKVNAIIFIPITSISEPKI